MWNPGANRLQEKEIFKPPASKLLLYYCTVIEGKKNSYLYLLKSGTKKCLRIILNKQQNLNFSVQNWRSHFFLVFVRKQAAKVSRVDRNIPKSSSSHLQVIWPNLIQFYKLPLIVFCQTSSFHGFIASFGLKSPQQSGL